MGLSGTPSLPLHCRAAIGGDQYVDATDPQQGRWPRLNCKRQSCARRCVPDRDQSLPELGRMLAEEPSDALAEVSCEWYG